MLCVPAGAGPLQQLIELGGPGAVVHSLDAVSSSSSSSSSSIGGSSSSSSRKTAAAGVIIPRLEGDFSLNAANVLSADLLLRSGLSRLCPTHDLNVSASCCLQAVCNSKLHPANAQQGRVQGCIVRVRGVTYLVCLLIWSRTRLRDASSRLNYWDGVHAVTATEPALPAAVQLACTAGVYISSHAGFVDMCIHVAGDACVCVLCRQVSWRRLQRGCVGHNPAAAATAAAAVQGLAAVSWRQLCTNTCPSSTRSTVFFAGGYTA